MSVRVFSLSRPVLAIPINRTDNAQSDDLVVRVVVYHDHAKAVPDWVVKLDLGVGVGVTDGTGVADGSGVGVASTRLAGSSPTVESSSASSAPGGSSPASSVANEPKCAFFSGAAALLVDRQVDGDSARPRTGFVVALKVLPSLCCARHSLLGNVLARTKSPQIVPASMAMTASSRSKNASNPTSSVGIVGVFEMHVTPYTHAAHSQCLLVDQVFYAQLKAMAHRREQWVL